MLLLKKIKKLIIKIKNNICALSSFPNSLNLFISIAIETPKNNDKILISFVVFLFKQSLKKYNKDEAYKIKFGKKIAFVDKNELLNTEDIYCKKDVKPNLECKLFNPIIILFSFKLQYMVGDIIPVRSIRSFVNSCNKS